MLRWRLMSTSIRDQGCALPKAQESLHLAELEDQALSWPKKQAVSAFLPYT
jgi:hypothetical protein